MRFPADNNDGLESESNTGTGEPDTNVLKLYHVLNTLYSNPLKLKQFPQERQVYISLLWLLRRSRLHLMPSPASLSGQQNQMTVHININWTAYQCGIR
jgi:hypothetical protein